MRAHFSEAQILEFLRAAAAGTPVMELCWNHCFSRATFRAWKARYRAAIDDDAARITQLERENARLRRTLALELRGASTGVESPRPPPAHAMQRAQHRGRYRDQHAAVVDRGDD
jgi:putative transposase